MTDQPRDQASFGNYLKSPETSSHADPDTLKKIDEETHADEDRLQRINEIVGAYESQAKESEEMLLSKKHHHKSGLDRINAEAAIIGANPNYSLGGDVEQFVTELQQDIPEEEKRPGTVSQSPKKEQRPDKAPKVITIDLQGAQQAECIKKQNLYKRRQASPTAQVHERLFAIAQERKAKVDLQEFNKLNSKSNVKPAINKTSTAIVAKMRSDSAIDKTLYQDFFQRQRKAEQAVIRERRAIDENINRPKTDFASEELARHKLGKDLEKAYDTLVKAQADIEFKPQMLVEMLSLLGIFKELKLASDVVLDQDNEAVAKKLGMSISSGPQEESKPNNVPATGSSTALRGGTPLCRKYTEQHCMKAIWKFLSSGGRDVTKQALTGTIYTLLTFDDSISLETKSGLVKEAAGMKENEESAKEINEMISEFEELSREAKATRYLAYFATKLKTLKNPREEKEAKECSFVPAINKKSRKLDVEKMKEKASSKGANTEGTKFKGKQRSQSPPRHDILYENYKEIMSKLQKEQAQVIAEKSKDLTFRPKISKPLTKKPHEDQSQLFNRLHEAGKGEAKLSIEYRPYEERLLDGCTFKPTISDSSKRSAVPEKKTTTSVKGYDQSVKRYQAAAEEKRKLQDKIDKSSRGANYDELKKKDVKPFSFQSRQQKAGKEKSSAAAISVEVAVKVGKPGKITLHADDDPMEVASNFSKIYHLGKEDLEQLQGVLKEQLVVLNSEKKSSDKQYA